ncbi:MAG: pirin family protein [Burkholderiales bacterium]
MIKIRKAQDRGTADFGWLHSRHTFSFGSYHDPENMGFSDLLVINDDRVEPAMGFGRHPHRDMEIFSYVLEGKLEHKDSMGTGSVINTGDVQMMSAGTGIMHSEFNGSKEKLVHFLQIWIQPNKTGVVPRYQQKYFSGEEKRGRFCLIISPDGSQGSLGVYQDARVYAGLFDGGEAGRLSLPPNRYAYVHVARGDVKINGLEFEAGDGARVTGESELRFAGGKQAEVLVFDLRPRDESPGGR